MIAEDQSAAENFLKAQQALAGPAPDAQIITTHISKVFIAGERAFKLKRAVRFPYLDFSTAAARYAACQRELELNRRTAPNLYLAVRRITSNAGGEISFDGKGALIDAVVEMRRFDQTALFDNLALSGALTSRMIADLAHRIALFHETAEAALGNGGAAGMAAVLDINERSLQAAGLVSAAALDDLCKQFRAALKQHGDLLERRRAAGKVRRCHGDLILRNICLIDGAPTLFDCLEFNEELATIDVLYDVAFLIMDLLHRGLAEHANALFNRYLDETDNSDGLALVGFFTAVRAAVRAHVTAARAKEMPPADAVSVFKEARDYLDLAASLLSRPRPRLVAIGGHSGSGKSTIAAAIAPALGLPPGARVLSSDRIRKRLYGVRPEQRLPQNAYTPEISARVYAAMRDEALQALNGGCSVVTDAVFDRPADRNAIETVAREATVPFNGIWLEASAGAMAERIERRSHDPSDATVEILTRQLQRDPGMIAWHRIDAARPVAAVVGEALASVRPDAAAQSEAAELRSHI